MVTWVYESMKGIIYKATHIVSGRPYIGQTTKDLDRRKWEHLNLASRTDSPQSVSHFIRALRKYGAESFEWEVLEECETQEELDIQEVAWIKEFDSFRNGFNSTTGGEHPVKSDSVIRKHKLASYERNRSWHEDSHPEEGDTFSVALLSWEKHQLYCLQCRRETREVLRQVKVPYDIPASLDVDRLCDSGQALITALDFLTYGFAIKN